MSTFGPLMHEISTSLWRGIDTVSLMEISSVEATELLALLDQLREVIIRNELQRASCQDNPKPTTPCSADTSTP